MVVAQIWDRSGWHVTWVITSTTGMDLIPTRGRVEIRSIYLVSGWTFWKYFFFLIKKRFFIAKFWRCLLTCFPQIFKEVNSWLGTFGIFQLHCFLSIDSYCLHFISCFYVLLCALSDTIPSCTPPCPPPMQIRTSHTLLQAAGCSVILHDQLRPSWQLCEQFH